MKVDVELVEFPETRVAAVEYRGPEGRSIEATMKLVAWRKARGVGPDDGETYGVHHTDPITTPHHGYRMDVCVSYSGTVGPNPQGVIAKVIPGGRCARVTRIGTRDYIPEADYLYREWLPRSGEATRDFPLFFHYVNVGPHVKDEDMITDVYLPIR